MCSTACGIANASLYLMGGGGRRRPRKHAGNLATSGIGAKHRAPVGGSRLPTTMLRALLPTGSHHLGRQNPPIRRKVNRRTLPTDGVEMFMLAWGVGPVWLRRLGSRPLWIAAQATSGFWGLERAAHAPIRDSRPMVASGTTGPRSLTSVGDSKSKGLVEASRGAGPAAGGGTPRM